MTERTSRRHGGSLGAVGALVAACALWGSTFAIGKPLLSTLSVTQVVLYRFAVGSLVLLPVAGVSHRWPPYRTWPRFIVTGFLAVPVTFLVQFQGLSLTTASSAALLMGALPAVAALLGRRFAGELLGPVTWLAVGLSTIGVAVLAGGADPQHGLQGDVLVLVSLVALAVSNLMTKPLVEAHPPLMATTCILASGTLALLPIAAVDGGLVLPSPSAALGVVVLGLACTAVAYLLWNWSLRSMPAGRATVFTNLEPLVGAALGVAVLKERLGWNLVVGALLILAAALLAARPTAGGRAISRSRP